MDASFNVNRLSRELHKRGKHRLLGNPFLGSLTAFLTLLVLIRITANFYIVIALSNTNPRIDAVQIASALFVFLSAYMVWVGTLNGCRIALSLPRLCYIDFAICGKRFRSMFMRQVAFFRPVTIAYLSIMLLTALVFSGICGSWGVILFRCSIALCSVIAAVIFVTVFASGSGLSRPEIQVMEVLYLLFLLALNPDIGSYNDLVSLHFLFGKLRFPFYDLWTFLLAVGSIVLLALLVLFIVRVLTGVNNLFHRQISLSPMESWYWRFLRIRSWVFLYVIVTPIFVSSTISLSVKVWTLVATVLFGVAAYLYFINHCENSFNEKWRCSLLDKGNIRLIARSVLVHAVLMFMPVLGYVVFR
jgi:hypothetical protein